MKKFEKPEDFVKEYQCPGCIVGCFENGCYKKEAFSVACEKHSAGTIISGIGTIFLGMPKGFNRLGICENLKIRIYVDNDEIKNTLYQYKENPKYTIPVWKYLDENGNTLIRGYMPRRNEPFLEIFKGDVRQDVDCLEITKEDVDFMD